MNTLLTQPQAQESNQAVISSRDYGRAVEWLGYTLSIPALIYALLKFNVPAESLLAAIYAPAFHPVIIVAASLVFVTKVIAQFANYFFNNPQRHSYLEKNEISNITIFIVMILTLPLGQSSIIQDLLALQVKFISQNLI